ncbi:MAG: hypothetical protein JWR69_3898 [Pedosphaera sp.]|nr:hypothetical protein [Pedosphaera sp.]
MAAITMPVILRLVLGPPFNFAALNAGGLSVNGVTFHASSDLPGAANAFNDGYGNPGTPDTNSNTLLQAAAYNHYNDAASSISWNGMTTGHTYLVQLWVNDARSIGTTRFEGITGGTNTASNLADDSNGGGAGQFKSQ